MPNSSDWHNHKIDKPKNDNDYFERMCRVILMAGLNWHTLEKKWPGIKIAFNDFNISKVANYQEADVEELMLNPAVIRNLPKIRAIVTNAKTFQKIKNDKGSFANYLSELRQAGGEDVMRETLAKQFAFLGKGTTVTFLFSVGEDLPKARNEWESLHR